MTFLNPLVLYFLPLLAVPIVIHLLNLYKPKKVYFPRVDLLEKIAETSSTRLKVKNWLILLMRVLFVGFLILAFSQPYFPNQNSTNKEGNILIYVDNSPSMFVQENGYQPISVATDVALKIVNGLSESQKVYVITNEFSYKEKISLSKKQAKDRLINVSTNLNSRTLEAVVNRAELLFSQESLAKIFLVSDLQNHRKEDLVDFDDNVVLIPIDQGDFSNVVVDSVWFDSPAMIYGRNAKLNIRVKGQNILTELSNGVEVSIAGNVIASQHIIWSENENEKILEVNFDLGTPGLYAAEVKIDDVPVNFDNWFSFVFEVLKEVDVTVLSNTNNSALFKVYRNEPLFNVKFYKDGESEQSHVASSKLLIIEGMGLVRNNANLIDNRLKEGATVLIVPDESDDDYRGLSDYFNISIVDSVRKELNVNEEHSYFSGVLLNSKENVIKPWYISEFDQNESLSYVLFNNFKNGGIGFKNRSRGKIGVLPFPLSDKNTNLHRHAFFVPLMYEIAFHASGSKMPLFYRTKNKVVSLPIEEKPEVIELVKEEEVLIAQKSNGKYSLGSGLSSGIYSVNDKNKFPVLAINHDLKESNIKFMSSDDLEDMNVEVLNVGDELKLQQYFKNLSLGFALWKYCLILSLLFLIVEIALIRFLR